MAVLPDDQLFYEEHISYNVTCERLEQERLWGLYVSQSEFEIWNTGNKRVCEDTFQQYNKKIL